MGTRTDQIQILAFILIHSRIALAPFASWRMVGALEKTWNYKMIHLV